MTNILKISRKTGKWEEEVLHKLNGEQKTPKGKDQEES